MSRATFFAALLLAFVLAQPTLSATARAASAQETQQPQTSSGTPNAAQPLTAEQQNRERRLRLKEEEEEGEADPNAAFRHSAAVKWISKKTGMSIDAAFWLCMAVNFAVVVLVLWLALRNIVPALYRNRFSAIQQRLEEARKTSEDARQRLAQVEARLSRLDSEIEQMRQEAEASSRHEEERVLATVEEERRRIVESAEQEIARIASAARRDLRAYAAELAVSLAEKRIKIDEHADQKLVRDFASRLGRNGN